MTEQNGTTKVPKYGIGKQAGEVDEVRLQSTGTQDDTRKAIISQYGIGKTLLVWLAAAIPMGVLGWFVAPALAQGSSQPGFVRLAVLTVGLFWQFVLVLGLLFRETGSLRLSVILPRLWVQQPRSPRSGAVDRRLWWWLVPLIVLGAVYSMQISSIISHYWVTLFPALAEPPGFSMSGFLSTPEGRAKLVGAWGFYALFLLNAVLNTVIGEELLFRGLLLPRMSGSFGRWSWVANGLLFGFYHFHQPWVMADAAVQGMFLLALPSKRFQSAWYGIVIHSLESVFFAFILLGLVLGRA
ncbi:MAG TPA: CPBP family intramembrane glutamic endopeptidase [Anaerolineales bacterium]|nr:CPBP family intramembrane glutamic endopeptidase [Anaerolineales bacterium]